MRLVKETKRFFYLLEFRPPETDFKKGSSSVQGLWRRRRSRRRRGGGGGGGEGNEAAGAFPPHQGRNEGEVNC